MLKKYSGENWNGFVKLVSLWVSEILFKTSKNSGWYEKYCRLDAKCLDSSGDIFVKNEWGQQRRTRESRTTEAVADPGSYLKSPDSC